MTDRGLLVDYGGVLTGPVLDGFRQFEQEEGLPEGMVLEALVAAYREGRGDSPIATFERGEISMREFEELLVTELASRGHDISPERLVPRLFEGLRPAGPMWDVVAQVRAAGIPTGLLSNSWGTEHYPYDQLAEYFDVQVISGEIGIRKPDPRIYRLAAERIGLPLEACAFVDDLDRNVEAASELGMFGVHHTGVATTVEALSGFLEIELDVPA